MRLRHIEIFYAVYANGSITAAAHVLNVSQPSVSKALMHAESQIGFPLFKRTAGRLIPTEEAHVLFEEVRPIFERLETLRLVAHNLRSGSGGHIRLAVVPALALDVAPIAISNFRAINPGVNFSVKVLHHDEVDRTLLTRETDVAIVYDPVEHPLLQTFKVGSGEIIALSRRSELTDSDKRLTLNQLADVPYIGSADTGPVSDILDIALARRSLVLNEVVSVDAYYAAVELVRRGGGVALVDEYTAKSRLADGLSTHHLEADLSFGVYCVHAADRPLSRLARTFVTEFKLQLRQARSRHNLTA
ncbi:LysR family transcriptional regulator [Qipengyuania sp. ASV99]|uniref:LysR family transcriptional regulator n=1 Tax=Qipengyuania sp. ASV99 TaxID=3399681 RepID=UPI003A4C7A3E